MFKLLWCKIEIVVGIKIEYEPYQNDDGKSGKPHTIFDCRKQKRDQKYPKGDIVGCSDQSEGVCTALPNRSSISRIFSKPREPRGGMNLNHCSIQHTNNGQAHQPPSCGPQ